MNRHRLLMKAWLGLVLVVLALPILCMIALSFNRSRYGTLPFHFSLDWYRGLAGDTALIDALRTSIELAAEVTVLSVVLGTLLSFGVVRARPVVSGTLSQLQLMVLTVPAIILAAGLLTVFDWFGLGQSTTGLVIASVVTSMPFVVLVVSARLRDLDPRYAEASRTLGAGPMRTFATITAPLVAPAIVAGALLAFVMCFNNFAIQLFTAPIGVSTLPVQIYSMVRLGVTPDVIALGTIIVCCTVAIIVILHLVTGSAARVFIRTNKED